MEAHLSSDNDVQQEVSDEDDFIAEEVEGDSANQLTEKQILLQPTKGMLFDSKDDAINFYKNYAKKTRFGVTKRGYFTLTCNRQGKAQYTSKDTFKPNPSTRMQECSVQLK
jgi:hypothetical protein